MSPISLNRMVKQAGWWKSPSLALEHSWVQSGWWRRCRVIAMWWGGPWEKNNSWSHHLLSPLISNTYNCRSSFYMPTRCFIGPDPQIHLLLLLEVQKPVTSGADRGLATYQSPTQGRKTLLQQMPLSKETDFDFCDFVKLKVTAVT